MSLAWQMAIGTLLGIMTGLFCGDACAVLAPWSSAYIMILKISTIPYLICAIIHGIGQLHSAQALQILRKGLFFIGLAFVVNILMIYGATHLFPHAESTHLANYTFSSPGQINFAELLIPENIFYSLSKNLIPSIVVFALIVGVSLMHIKDKEPLMGIFEILVKSFTKITSWISKITPLGTFLLLSYQVGTLQLSTIKQVSTYIIVYILIICSIVFWIFPRIINSLTNIPSSRWLKDLIPILILGFTTNVVIVCLPFIIELIKREMKQFIKSEETINNQIQGIVSVIFNLPLGMLFITIFVFFIALFYGTTLTPSSQGQLFINTCLASLGSSGIGSWINSLSFILETLGLPQEGTAIYLTTLPFTAGFQAMVSVMEIASLSLLIMFACHDLLVIKIPSLLRKSFFTVTPVLLILIGMKSFNPLPVIQNLTPSIYDLQIPSLPILSNTTSLPRTEDPLLQILKTKTLRVGFNPNTAPFCFKNHHNQIVGFDIAFAKQLGKDLGCEVLLVPMNYHTIADQLSRNEFDIAMSAISINEMRLKEMYFSNPYLQGNIVFVSKETERKKFSKSRALDKHPQVKIAVFKNTFYELLAHTLFPNHDIITIDAYDNLLSSEADLLLWSEPQAISWVVRHPGYAIVYPNPAIGADLFAYALPQGADLFLHYINLWLKLKEADGFSKRQYGIWILGLPKASSKLTNS